MEFDSFTRFTQKDWDDFNYHYQSDRLAQTFLSNYDYTDVVAAELRGSSTAIWGISPPAQVQRNEAYEIICSTEVYN